MATKIQMRGIKDVALCELRASLPAGKARRVKYSAIKSLVGVPLGTTKQASMRLLRRPIELASSR